MFGEGIFNIAIIAIVSKYSGSVMALSYMFILTMLPSVFLGPITGYIIDKFNKAYILMICSLMRFLFIIAVPILSYFGMNSIWIIYASILLSYIIWYMISPTTESLIKEILNEDEYVQGTSFTQAAWQTGLLISAVLAGTLLKFLGDNHTLMITSIVYILSAIIYLKILRLKNKKSSHEKEKAPSQHLFKDIKEGWIYFKSDKKLMLIALSACSAIPFFTSINIMIGPFNYKVVNGDDFSLGLIDSAAGIGSFLSVGFCLWISEKKKSLTYLILSFVFLTISIILFSQSSSIIMAFLLYIAVGLFIGNVKVLSKSLIYTIVHHQFVGRIMSLISMLSLSIGIILSLFIGFLGGISIKLTYLFIGLLMFIPAVFLFYLKLKTPKERELNNEKNIIS